MIQHDTTWHDAICRNMTWRNMTWHNMTCHNAIKHILGKFEEKFLYNGFEIWYQPPYMPAWHVMTQHDKTWHDMVRHNMTQHDMMWHDIMWRDVTFPREIWRKVFYQMVLRFNTNHIRCPIWHDATWHGATWHYATCRDVTWQCDAMWRFQGKFEGKYSIKWFWGSIQTTLDACTIWHDATWHGATWHGATWHYATWHDVTWHNVTRCDVSKENLKESILSNGFEVQYKPH